MTSNKMEMLIPENDVLRRHICYIYKYSNDDPLYKRQFILFPNIGSAITIVKDAAFNPAGKSSYVSIEQKGENAILLQINRVDPILIEESGKHNRIGIVFKPMGVNQFLRDCPGDLLRRFDPSRIPLTETQFPFEYFVTDNKISLNDLLPKIETWLLERYIPFTNEALERCIDEFMNPDGIKSLKELSEKYFTTPKTINRLFHKHIGLAPIAFRRIAQFRNAVNNRKQNNNCNYGQIAFDNQYCDTSYMINTFRELTGTSAGKFFRSISFAADGRYLYKENV